MNSEDIKKYLLQNPVDRTKENPYAEAAKILGVDKELVRRVWRTLREKGLVEQSNTETWEESYEENRHIDGSVRIKDVVDRRLTDEEIFERYGRNSAEWRILSVWFKDKADKVFLSVHFAPLKQAIELKNQKEFILEEIKNHAPKLKSRHDTGYKFRPFPKECLYEISIPDLHIGKLSWEEEVGEDYDIKIAIERYNTAIDELISRINLAQVEKFLLPIGNDLLNVDGKANLTTGGTPQSVDSRFGKMFLTAKNLLIATIDKLSLIAPVDVVIVAGNHDNLNMFTLGEVLSAWYHNTEDVTVNNSPKQRKYYQYGNTGIQFTHGNEEKHLELGLIFATEESRLWADTKYRFCQLGHYHKNKKLNYVSVDEEHGFQVQIVPSLSGTDAWHYSKGYNSLKQAKSFLIHKTKGIIGEFSYTV